MALTENRDVDHFVDQELRSFQIDAAKHVFKGGFVGLAPTGYARSLVAGDPFVGIAYEEVDNTAGAAGALTVRVYTLGDFGLAMAGTTIADVGKPVFGSADDTLSFTATGNSYLGVVEDLISAGEIMLRIDPTHSQVKTITHAVENLAAGADIAARAVHRFDRDAWVVGARIVNQATASAGIDDSNTCVVTLATGAGTVATDTFDSTTTFPTTNTSADLGAISNAHAAAGSVLTLAVTNGAAADPGGFLVEIDYV